MRTWISIAGAALVGTLVLFEVDVDVRFSLPKEVEQVDAEHEALFEQCMDEQDRVVHAETFAAIDNPDVQREVLARRMRQAAQVCRAEFPQRTVVVRRPLDVNVVDLTPRFWEQSDE